MQKKSLFGLSGNPHSGTAACGGIINYGTFFFVKVFDIPRKVWYNIINVMTKPCRKFCQTKDNAMAVQ